MNDRFATAPFWRTLLGMVGLVTVAVILIPDGLLGWSPPVSAALSMVAILGAAQAVMKDAPKLHWVGIVIAILLLLVWIVIPESEWIPAVATVIAVAIIGMSLLRQRRHGRTVEPR